MATLPESVDYADKDFDTLRVRLIKLVKRLPLPTFGGPARPCGPAWPHQKPRVDARWMYSFEAQKP